MVRGVKPEQLDAPTPCRDWDVRTLANHLLQVISALNLVGRGAPIPEDMWQRELMSAGWADRFEAEARQAVAAWAGQVAGERDQFIGTMLVSDLVIHGWDLARATGQGYRCDDEDAELTRKFVADTGEQGRGMGIYGEPVPVGPAASALDQALALSGRDPGWRAPG